ncbi:imelysin family protein [Polaribacter tangerinus]|uniref:imelysin family protein n=1 Tax=Polaribacter tangerinus TaxID=1920034 RepID=UPI000B4BE2F8|nr:imelysin family protein [Polaribacter tangerinus]
MFKKIFPVIITLFILSSCSSTEEENPVLKDSFDRKGMLTNIADNIIIPAYEDFSSKMALLKTEGNAFIDNPNIANLESLRNSWLTAYKSWQHIEMYNIGKANEILYKFHINIYPVTVTDIDDNIKNGSYDLNSANNHDAQGFPALDYLLFGLDNSDSKIIEKYTIDTNKENFKKYLYDVIAQMSSLTNIVVTDFKEQRNVFVNNTVNTLSGSVNQLVNDYIFYYEKGLRANKIGIPSGIFSSTPLPQKVEAFYNNTVSKELTLEALSAVQNLFEGKHFGKNTKGLGFNDYLITLNRNDLATSISNQFTIAKTAIEKLNNSFSIQINSDNVAMTKAYDELQKNVVLMKVDMIQTFNISVDYVDADGD